MALHSLLKGGWSEVGVSLFSQVATKETAPNCTRRGSDCMLQKSFTERIVKHWNRLSREMVESPSQEEFNVMCHQRHSLMVDLVVLDLNAMILKIISNLNDFMIL